MAEAAHDHDGGDVLILGAGAAGLLAARAVSARGFGVTLIESDALASGQSAHSHGYLHRGYIYLHPSDRLVGPLQAAATYWERLISSLGVEFETRESLVGFGDGFQFDHGQGMWAMSNLRGHRPVGPTDLVDGVKVEDSMFANHCRHFAVSPEKVVDFSKVVPALAAKDLARVNLVTGRVTAIDTERDRVERVHVNLPDGTAVRVRARLYLFTMGVGNLALMKAARGHVGPMTVRQSYMLVLRSRSLPVMSAVFPGPATCGLFIASRRPVGSEPTVWLVSNHSSFAGVHHGRTTARLWLRQVVRTLAGHSDVLDLPDLEWAMYPAPKAEIRGLSTLEQPGIVNGGWRNAIAAFPTKLTLAPLLADQIVTWASVRLARRGEDPLEIPGAARPPVAPELWRSCQWYDRDALLAFHHAPSAAFVPE